MSRLHDGAMKSQIGFDRRIQTAELAYMRASRTAQAAFAENYVGLPLE